MEARRAARREERQRNRAQAAVVDRVGTARMRLLFARQHVRINGVVSAAETIAQIREDLGATSLNVGNLVHLEAMPKLLRYDRRRGLARFDAGLPSDGAQDGVVFGYANLIRAYDHLSPAQRDAHFAPMIPTTAWLQRARCRIYALGIGIQDRLPPRADAVDPRLFALLKALNDRAEIFGVRGAETEAWCHAVGLTNARALGCPSMFVYPRNVMAIRSPSREAPLRIASAGRLQRNSDPDRLGAIVRIGAALDTSYIFQNDFFAAFRAQDGDVALFNDATGEVRRDQVKARGAALGFDLPFNDYWLFRSTDQWRAFAGTRQAYFGDRFHGGVVFMQAGRPAIIVQNDDRVKELTSFYDLPTASSAEIMASDPAALLHDRLAPDALARMRRTYAARYRKFYDALHAGGLSLFNDLTPDAIDAMI